jgi:hypothetical protein
MKSLMSVPVAYAPPADMIVADVTVDEVRIVQLSNHVIRVLDAETGFDVTNRRCRDAAHAADVFAALVAEAGALL